MSYNEFPSSDPNYNSNPSTGSFGPVYPNQPAQPTGHADWDRGRSELRELRWLCWVLELVTWSGWRQPLQRMEGHVLNERSVRSKCPQRLRPLSQFHRCGIRHHLGLQPNDWPDLQHVVPSCWRQHQVHGWP